MPFRKTSGNRLLINLRIYAVQHIGAILSSPFVKGRDEKMKKKIILPLTDKDIAGLKAGDNVLLSGTLYVARDAAHKRMIEQLDKGEPLPFNVKGQTIYYMGPSPAPPGHVIGSAGPTTSKRMDIYTPRLLEAGLKAMIGKGIRSPEVKEAMKKHKAVYFAAIGGAGALISKSIVKAEVIAYPDLGPEAVLKIEAKNFPATVINDISGGDLYEKGKKEYTRL
jgi:fumarate hydratase subunit beta